MLNGVLSKMGVVNEDILEGKMEIEESNENHTQNPSSNESTTSNTYANNNLTPDEVVSNSNNTGQILDEEFNLKINVGDNILSEHIPQLKDGVLINNLISNVLTDSELHYHFYPMYVCNSFIEDEIINIKIIVTKFVRMNLNI